MALKPSDRATLMKEIATRLGAEEYPFIDMTLNTFGLPTSETWNGSSTSYTLEMTKGADDGVLVELAEHLGFQLTSKAVRVEPPFWRKGMFRLFITHLAKHRAFAAELQKELQEYGVTSFVAHNDIEPTLEWQNEIETALSTCEALVTLLHPGFHGSNWADQELGFAMGRGVPVFAIAFGEDPYGFIARFQAFSGTHKEAKRIAQEVFEALLKGKQTQRRVADMLVGLFCESWSFAQSRSYIGYLEQIGVWDSSYSARLKSAVKHNRQVSESFGVPDRVQRLVDKWK